MKYDVPTLVAETESEKFKKSKRYRRRIVTKLAVCNDDRACKVLAQVLTSDQDVFSRALAAKGLGLHSVLAAQTSLICASNDSSSKVRAQIANALERHPTAESAAALESLLVTDADETVRQTAASGLARLSEVGGQEALIRALDHESAATRRFVIYAIGEVGDKSTIPLLKDRQDGETRLNKGAIQSVIKTLDAGG